MIANYDRGKFMCRLNDIHCNGRNQLPALPLLMPRWRNHPRRCCCAGPCAEGNEGSNRVATRSEAENSCTQKKNASNPMLLLFLCAWLNGNFKHCNAMTKYHCEAQCQSNPFHLRKVFSGGYSDSHPRAGGTDEAASTVSVRYAKYTILCFIDISRIIISISFLHLISQSSQLLSRNWHHNHHTIVLVRPLHAGDQIDGRCIDALMPIFGQLMRLQYLDLGGKTTLCSCGVNYTTSWCALWFCGAWMVLCVDNLMSFLVMA